MTYTQEISQRHPALFVFLLDQSAGMAELLGGDNPEGRRKMDELADQLNAWLAAMTAHCFRASGVRHYLDVAVIGYRTDSEANPLIESAFLKPELAQKSVCSITDVSDQPDIRQVTRSFLDDASGETFELTEEVPVWVDPQAEGGSPQCWALHRAHEVVEEWISRHPESYPPIVIHMTGGEATDGDPLPYAEALLELEAHDGNVLLFHCLLHGVDVMMFPHSLEDFPDALGQLLFRMSSELPAPIFKQAVQEGYALQPGARGLAYNADLSSLTKFLEVGCD